MRRDPPIPRTRGGSLICPSRATSLLVHLLLLGLPIIGCADEYTPSAPDDTTPGDDGIDGIHCDGLTIQTEDDLAAISDCEIIDGKLRLIFQDWPASLDLPNLISVTDDLQIDSNTALTTISVPNLASVDGYVRIYVCQSLIELDMTGLKTVGSTLHVEHADALLNLDGLRSVATVGSLTLKWNDCISQEEAEGFAESIEVDGEVKVWGNGTQLPCD